MNFVKRLGFVTPFLFTLAFMSQQSDVFASAIGAEEATKLLARSLSLEEKCKFLNANQHEELATFVAKAEIAMVAKSSAKSAKSLIANGRALGQSATCSDSERADIVSIIKAAHQATSGSAQMVSKIKLQPEPIAQTGGLNRYAELTQRYYIARRCNTMSYASITSLYKDVVSTHKNAISSFGVPAVRTVMNQSASKANASRCSK